MIEKELIDAPDKHHSAMSFAMQVAFGIYKQIMDGEISPGHNRIEYRIWPVKGDKPEPVLWIKWKDRDRPLVMSEERLRRTIAEQNPEVNEIVLMGCKDVDPFLFVINKDHSKKTYVWKDHTFQDFIQSLFDDEIEKLNVDMRVWNELAAQAKEEL